MTDVTGTTELHPAAATVARPGALLRVLGTAFGLAIVVGATVGGGILRTPGEIATALPSAPLFLAVWIFGGVNTLLGANAYAELGAMIPSAGGPYVYARRAFGDWIAFFVGYADWVNWCLGPVVLILIVGEYTGGLIPALAGHPLAVDFTVLGALAVLQWIGVRSGGRTQEITTALKAVALVALVLAAFVLPHAALGAPEAPPTPAAHAPRGLPLLLAIGVAMQGVIFTYDSYYAPVYCAEEMRDPGREIPRSMFRGVWLIIGIYLLVNLAYLAVVPITRMAGDPFVGATMARSIFGRYGDPVIRVIMLVSVIGTINAELMAAPRILLAMARDGLFPRQAARVNAGGTPAVALGLSLLLIVGFVLSGSFAEVLGIDAFLIVLMYTVAFASLFALRRREPDTPRPYRARGYPLVPGIALAVAIALVVAIAAGAPRDALIVLAVLAASWPLSRLVRWAMGSEPAPTD